MCINVIYNVSSNYEVLIIHTSVTCYLIFPIPTLEKPHKCELVIASAPQSSFNPSMLTASLAGLRGHIIDRQYEVLLPEIEADKQDGFIAQKEEDLDNDDEEEDSEEGIYQSVFIISLFSFFLVY